MMRASPSTTVSPSTDTSRARMALLMVAPAPTVEPAQRMELVTVTSGPTATPSSRMLLTMRAPASTVHPAPNTLFFTVHMVPMLVLAPTIVSAPIDVFGSTVALVATYALPFWPPGGSAGVYHARCGGTRARSRVACAKEGMDDTLMRCVLATTAATRGTSLRRRPSRRAARRDDWARTTSGTTSSGKDRSDIPSRFLAP
mmetsp:Transcript_10456/g.33097  ORF Transcript_10456/g.33097 Transcript_10456/m.33097 type:complete len:200 (-) Transcript_10456:1025-1624(-)